MVNKVEDQSESSIGYHVTQTGSGPKKSAPGPEVAGKKSEKSRFSPGNPSQPLGTPSAPFWDGPRQIWGRKRKYHCGGSNPEPLACQPHVLTTGLPRLTHNKTEKIDVLILQLEKARKKPQENTGKNEGLIELKSTHCRHCRHVVLYCS